MNLVVPISMTPLATNTTALFLPQDSPLSQAELFTRDRKPHHSQHLDDWSPSKPASEGIPLARHQVENKAEYQLGESKATVSKAVVQKSGPQQCDLGPQWLPLNNPVEMEWHLRVSIRASDLIIYAFAEGTLCRTIINFVLCKPIRTLENWLLTWR